MSIWCAGLFFFLVNCYIMYTVIDKYKPSHSIPRKAGVASVHYSKTTQYSKVKHTSQSHKSRYPSEIEVEYDTRASLSKSPKSPSRTSRKSAKVEVDNDNAPRYRLRTNRKTWKIAECDVNKLGAFVLHLYQCLCLECHIFMIYAVSWRRLEPVFQQYFSLI